MTAPIVYADTRRPYEPSEEPWLADADRTTRNGWRRPDGVLWPRVRESSDSEVAP